MEHSIAAQYKTGTAIERANSENAKLVRQWVDVEHVARFFHN